MLGRLDVNLDLKKDKDLNQILQKGFLVLDAVQEGTRAGVEAVVDAGLEVCQVFVEIVEIFGGLAFLAEVSVAVFVSPEVLVAVFVIEHAIGAVDSQKHLEMQDFCPVELLPEGKTSEPGLILLVKVVEALNCALPLQFHSEVEDMADNFG